ncbi:hypothetical protein E1301_Tti003212 [Triplophysa tibetana]|uniref:Protocadherin-9 n=1 Tax=Triplophysa tibetana TaxID=1572043 RepID=A0A5A9PP96_9TELE|nr:hypothetical protein E1301_Tti003212 [Triplophysa tibetana]
MTGKCTRECDEYGHSDACWMPVRTSPERRPKATPPKLSTFMTSPGSSVADQPGTQETLAVASGDPSHLLGDRNRNLLNKKMASSSSSYDTFSSAGFSASEETSRPTEEIPLAPTGEYKPTQCGTLTRREKSVCDRASRSLTLAFYEGFVDNGASERQSRCKLQTYSAGSKFICVPNFTFCTQRNTNSDKFSNARLSHVAVGANCLDNHRKMLATRGAMAMQRMSPLYNQSIGNNLTYDGSNNMERSCKAPGWVRCRLITFKTHFGAMWGSGKEICEV